MSTPTPWAQGMDEHRDRIQVRNGIICTTRFPWIGEFDDPADAALIVRAVNAHDALVDALRGFVDLVEALATNESFKAIHTVAFTHGFVYDGPTWIDPLAAATAALKLAEES